MSAWPRHGRSFEAQLSVLVAVAVGVAVALACVVSYVAVSRHLYSSVNATLRDDLARCESPSSGYFGPGGGASDESCFEPIVRNGGVVAIFTAQGQNVTTEALDSSLLGSGLQTGGQAMTATSAELALAKSSSSAVELSDATYSGKPYRVLAVAGSATLTNAAGATVTAPVVVLIAQPLQSTVATLSHLRLVLVLVVLLGIAIAIGLGAIVARATIRPVKRLTATAEHVAATQDLDATIDDEEREDELGRLAHAFNEMLAALRASRQQQAQLVSDAGHELRTPLTSLRTNIEFLMRAGELPAVERAELLTDVQAQLEELTALVGDIVETARQDEQQQREYTEVRFDTIVERAVERARRRAPSLTFDVQLTAGSVRAQPALLERAVLNVLDNAAKWSPPLGAIEVRLRRGDRWVLDVRDHGPGIAPEDLPKIFERFYRAPSARAMPGSGLGLAIVNRVVTDHGGSVQASGPPGGGTLVRVELPIVDEDEPGSGRHAEPGAGIAPELAAATWGEGDLRWGPPIPTPAPPGTSDGNGRHDAGQADDPAREEFHARP